MTPSARPGLPPLLQPWAGWLALFPDDLAATLGQLLLRLQPLVGPLRRHAARTAIDPAGVGDIVRRGSFERLLISEWAVADSVPEEFLRRAANGELLFTGPEPANSETSLASVALFDAGPAQLGEPRLAHIAIFILLARRAELAGAEFRWGILQEPGELHPAQGADSVRLLLGARTHAVLDDAGLAQWNAALAETAAECWLVGDPATPCPALAHSRVLVRRSWLEDQLEVELVQGRRGASVALPLPAPQDGVRLLRRPFDRPAAPNGSLLASKGHSLKRPPLFGTTHEWLALGMMDGSVTVYRVPDMPQAGTGRPRNQGKTAHANAIVGAGLIRRSYATVALEKGALRFRGFPGPIFGSLELPLPGPELFKPVPAALRLAPVFHWLGREQGVPVEEVLMLDKAGNLACWTGRGAPRRGGLQTDFRLVSRKVISAIQHGDRVLFAVADKGRTDVYSVSKGVPVREHLYPIMEEGEQLLFGELKAWRGGRGTYALCLGGSDWLAGDAAGADRITVGHRDIVLGCARGKDLKRPGVLVLDAERRKIALVASGARTTLLSSDETIAQASFDPAHGRLAWLGQASGALAVRDLHAAEPLLRVAVRGGAHAA